MTKMNVPKLRFKGFSGEWELDQLESVVLKKKSYPISRDYEVDESNTEYVHYGDIHIRKKGIIKYGDELPNILDGNYELLSSGDIVLADASEDYEEVAKPMLLENIKDRNIVAGLHTIALETINIDSKYLYYFMNTNTYKKSCYKLANGMKVYGISYNNLNKIVLGIPSTKEQNLIGLFLEKIDKLIELQTKKLEALKKLKQGYLQKMFPQDGDKVPRLRFKGFSDEWVKNGLLKLAKIRTGNKNAEDGLDKGDYVFFDRSSEVKFLDDFDYEGKVIVYSGEGSEFFPRKYNGKYSLHQRAYGLYDFQEINYGFLYQELLTKGHHFIKYAVGTTAKSLRKDCFESLIIALPSLEEQNKINEFLQYIDDLINETNEKIMVLNNEKKAYLQKMFM